MHVSLGHFSRYLSSAASTLNWRRDLNFPAVPMMRMKFRVRSCGAAAAACMKHRAFRHILPPFLPRPLDLQLVDGGCNFDSARVFPSYLAGCESALGSEGRTGERMKTADHDSISLSRRFSFHLEGDLTLGHVQGKRVGFTVVGVTFTIRFLMPEVQDQQEQQIVFSLALGHFLICDGK